MPHSSEPLARVRMSGPSSPPGCRRLSPCSTVKVPLCVQLRAEFLRRRDPEGEDDGMTEKDLSKLRNYAKRLEFPGSQPVSLSSDNQDLLHRYRYLSPPSTMPHNHAEILRSASPAPPVGTVLRCLRTAHRRKQTEEPAALPDPSAASVILLCDTGCCGCGAPRRSTPLRPPAGSRSSDQPRTNHPRPGAGTGAPGRRTAPATWHTSATAACSS